MKKLITLTFLLIYTSLFSQINPDTKWGKLSQVEIDYKEVTFEIDAPAVILFEEGRTSLTPNNVETNIYRRIKILKEKGIEAANQELLYYAYKSTEDINGLRAQT